ncbi:S-adenosylmethionine decarboxylase family protein [Psychrobacter sp. FDAARGOS_221]|uniref:S-adenosylmethionine decarboxylase family protein n=1 Tax=Psychrobacter sp. FDAARGOS_221 TaxID=1975705 RepID=UPI000BB56F09|nr:S-adenosylmethionine decarboxylase [Psychrobacter sp. FDAARGOS_221]PNK59781.1 S-adenosylmethionine decarboxylase proenzyme 2 [Psychrobacter sp. FDAARGOS_221]
MINSHNNARPADLNPRSPLNGKHILAEFWQCQCAPELLTEIEPLLTKLTQAVADAGLTLVGHAVHQFQPIEDAEIATDKISVEPVNKTVQVQSSGVTLTLLLAESHLCLHTWGEHNSVTLDVYVCNVTQDNSDKAQALFTACVDIFAPKQQHVNQVIRQHQPVAAITQ